MSRLLEELRTIRIDRTEKGMPFDADVAPAEVQRWQWNLLKGDLTLPLMVLKKSVLDYNLRIMDEWCAENNLLLAPHGKTTMCPQLYEMQFSHGAWAITVANLAQAMVCAKYGVKRIIIANQVAGTGNIKALAALINSDPTLELFCLVDSVAGTQQLAAGLAQFHAARPVKVLIEIGHLGWRTGIRSDQGFTQTLEEVNRHPQFLTVAGIEAFEGSARDAEEVDEFLSEFKYIGKMLQKRWPYAEKPLMSIGGSAYLDRVLLLSKEIGDDFQVVVRSGCYVTHDHGFYQRKHTNSLFRVKGEAVIPDFKPALELWSYVQSIPEKHLAFLTFGKRDAPFDIDMPIPLFSYRGQKKSMLSDVRIEKLNDQHAYLSLGDGVSLKIGDMVCCGISHPCTAFDKWRVVPVVNDDYDVIDLFRTFF